jgi:tetratricopeptide (TPR) repeat protein
MARAHLTCSQAHRVLGQVASAEDTARKALQLYSDLDHPKGTSLARTTLANALVDRGDLDAATEVYRQASDDLRRIGDRAGVVAVLNNLAVVKKRQGHLEQAQELYEETLQIYGQIDDAQGKANANNNLGVLLVEWDRLSEARERMTDALRQWEALEDTNGIAIGLANAGSLQRLLGDLKESRRLHERALEMRQRQGHKLGEATSRADLAMVLTDLGELALAAKHLDWAIEMVRSTGDHALLAHALFGLGEVRLAQGALEEARKAHEEAAALRSDLAQPLRVLDSRLAIARLTLEEGDLQRTEVLARQVAKLAELHARPTDEASALALLALALHAQGNTADARLAIAQAVERVAPSERAEPPIRVALADAQVNATTTAATENLERLARLERELTDKGYLGLRFETRLTWARVALRAGHTQAARERLENLMATAATSGYEHLAAQADQALR